MEVSSTWACRGGTPKCSSLDRPSSWLLLFLFFFSVKPKSVPSDAVTHTLLHHARELELGERQQI